MVSIMPYTQENDYGCTKWTGVSDMDARNGTLLEQMEKAGIPCDKTPLQMGSANAEPCYLVHYTATKSQMPVTVLVFPQAGIDSWAEDYYHFPGMTHGEAAQLNWYEVYTHVHQVAWETTKAKGQVTTRCPHCGKLDGVDGGGSYEDIRGRKRCSFCHELK